LGADDTISAIDDLIASGTISETDRATLIDDLVKNQEESLSNGSIYYGADGGIETYKNAKEILSSAERIYGKDSQQYKDAENNFNDIYGVKTIHGFGDPNQKQLGVDATEFGRANVGDKINVWWGEGKYKVEKGEEVKDPTVIEAVREKNFPEGASVFGLNGQIYIHYNGKVYSVNERNGKAYEALNSLLFGDGERIFVQGSGTGTFKDQNGKTYTMKQKSSTSFQGAETWYEDENGKRYDLKTQKGRMELVPQ
jgi:predicted heme/steroid binding protein